MSFLFGILSVINCIAGSNGVCAFRTYELQFPLVRMRAACVLWPIEMHFPSIHSTLNDDECVFSTDFESSATELSNVLAASDGRTSFQATKFCAFRAINFYSK